MNVKNLKSILLLIKKDYTTNETLRVFSYLLQSEVFFSIQMSLNVHNNVHWSFKVVSF